MLYNVKTTAIQWLDRLSLPPAGSGMALGEEVGRLAGIIHRYVVVCGDTIIQIIEIKLMLPTYFPHTSPPAANAI